MTPEPISDLHIKVVKKIYSSEETGFTVLKVTTKGAVGTHIIVGNLFDVKEGDFLKIEGESSTHPRFGEQIKVSRFTFIRPQDEEGIVKFLSSGRIKGVGPKTAQKIVSAFGLSTLDILEHSPDRLREISGMRKSVVESIKKNIREDRVIRDLTVKLAPHGIGKETIFKIHKEFGDRAMEVLSHNPYSLIEKIHRIGFKTADTIALGLGVPHDDPNRIAAGLAFIVGQYEQINGDLYVVETELLERCARLLDLDTDMIAEVIETQVSKQELIREEIPEKVVLNYKNFYIEKGIARLLHLYNTGQDMGSLPEKEIEKIYGSLDFTPTEEQKQAIQSALANKLTIITGGPGTGKTTIIRAIIQILQESGRRILIAAPTGRAAKRIEETSHHPASTIHRMLKVKPETREFLHNESNPLTTDTVIIDEFSMVDTYLFYALLRAVPRHAAIILIGDKDQLPSVGPGNLIRDMIACGFINTIYLSRNFRQTESSLIIENAYRINQGESLSLKPYSEELDFVYINVNSDRMALDKVLRIFEYHRNEYPANSAEFQILIPMYRGGAGIDTINRTIQERFNSEPFILKRERVAFKRLDKVMQLKNNYEKEIFNGELGTVADFNSEEKKMVVDFDGYFVEYSGEELEELTPAYAISIHKSQGSEYEIVVLVLLPSHAVMLNREIFYTAVSRAKKKLFLVSDPGTIQRALRNSHPRLRKTLLPRRLQELFEGPEPGLEKSRDSG